MTEPIQPIVPDGTPLPTPPVGVPPYPITPFAVWTWSTPVIPEFYWNIYSSEQRIKSICKEIGKIESYLNYLVNKTNENIIEIHQRIDQLTERVAALEKKVEEEVARLDALIAQLRADLEKEIADREAGDTALGERIDQEILDRTHGDQTLHQEIADEATARTHADDQLHTEISTETQARIHADDALHEEISHRLLPTDVQAGEEISITRPDPNSNTIVIASTVAHSIADLASTVSGLQAALTSETEERRADDENLWTAVNNRIERGKILAGTGIKVENDPDASTVTISATGGGTGGGSTTVTGTAPVEVTGTPEEGYTVSVDEAMEYDPGVISEVRVKQLAAIAYDAGDGIKIVLDPESFISTISINNNGEQNFFPVPGREEYLRYSPLIKEGTSRGLQKDVTLGPIEGEAESTKKYGGLALNPTPPSWASSSAAYLGLGVAAGTGLQVASSGELEAKPATESEAGIISEARVKELASGPSLSAEAPLKLEDGELSLTKDPAGPVTSSSAGISVREITPDTESEDETGVVSKKTIKSLLEPFSGSVNPEGGLELDAHGLLGVKLGVNPWQNPIGVGPDGELTLIGNSTAQVVREGIDVVAEPISGSTSWPDGFWNGKPDFAASTPAGTPASKAEFVLSSGYFEVRKSGSSKWEAAEDGTFELVSYPRKLREGGAAAGYPIEHSIYSRITPYGKVYYTPEQTSDSDDRVHIVGMRVHYSYYTVYVLPLELPTE